MKNEVKYETKNGRTVKKTETLDGVSLEPGTKKPEPKPAKNEPKKSEE